MKNKLIVKKKAHEHLLCIHTLDVVKSVYNVTKNSTPCSIDSSFASVGPYYVVNVSKQMNLCYQVLNEVFIKGAGLLNKTI